MRDKIRVVLYTAFDKGIENLVLGAFGCGQYGWEAETVATMFKAALESEFKGIFKRVVFAIPNADHPNHIAFKKVLQGA